MKRLVSVIALSVLLAGLSVTILPERAEAWIPHAPIAIYSNAGFTAANGVTGGSGTPGDPYVIEGWEIDATGTVGIRVNNVDLPFIIRDVYVHSDGSNDSANMFIAWAQDARIENVTLTDNKDALNVLITNNVTIVDSTISGENLGLHLDRADNTTLLNNTITPTNGYGFRFTQCKNLTMSGNTITGDGMWVQEYGDVPSLYDSHTITPDNLVNGKPLYYHSNCNGVDIDGIPVGQLIIASCSDVQVSNVSITDTSDAIQMFHVDNVAITNSTISASNFGVAIFYSTDVTLDDMDVHDSGYGVNIGASDAVSVTNSTFTSTSEAGLSFGGTGNGTIVGNVFVSSGIGLGLSLDDHDTLTIRDNTVNGDPVLYYNDCSGVELDGVPAGQVFMVSCDDVRVANLDVSDTTIGIVMAHTSRAVVVGNVVSHGTRGGMTVTDTDNLTLSGNTISSCGQNGLYASRINDAVISANQVSGSYYDGLRAGTMDNVTIGGNDFSHNGWSGIYSNNPVNIRVTGNILSHNNKSGANVYRTHWTTIAGNRAFSNLEHGLYIWDSDNLTVVANNVSSNGMDGIRLQNSADIVVHHNNIDNAPTQASDNRVNAWDNGYPSGGNYWSDYAGVDDCSGINQDICTGGDGIGDTNYTIDGDSVDNYPLMAPYVDADPPTVTIVSPAEDEALDVAIINVTGTATDAGLSGLVLVEVRINGGSWAPALGLESWTAPVVLSFGDNTIEARATDGRGNSAVAIVNVTLTNEPPTASFTVSPTSGDPSTEFTVDASGSSDPEDLTAVLEVRWDWENDGIWDTSWSTTKTAAHVYDTAGTYTIRLEVRDTAGNTHSATREVEVSEDEEELPMTLLALVALIILMVIVIVAAVISRMRREPEDEEGPGEDEQLTDEGQARQ